MARNGFTGAVGTITLGFGITNHGPACLLAGYPSVVFMGGSGVVRVVVSHRGEGPAFATGPVPVVVSASGAGFVLQYSDVPGNGQTTCPTVTSLQVRLPGMTLPSSQPERLSPCGAPNVSISAIESSAREHAAFA